MTISLLVSVSPNAWRVVLHLLACSLFASSRNSLPSSGASSGSIKGPANTLASDTTIPVGIIDVGDAVARRILAANRRPKFDDSSGQATRPGFAIARENVIEVSVWEAPRATLFGSTALDAHAGLATTRVTTFPERMVSHEGTIGIPCAGSISVIGKTPQIVAREIANRLSWKTNHPQVLVRLAQNSTSDVTVKGEFSQSLRMHLTAKGERLLDPVAAAGGVRQPVGKAIFKWLVTMWFKPWPWIRLFRIPNRI